MMHVLQRSRSWLSIVFNNIVEHLIRSFRNLLFWDRNRLIRETIEGYAAAIECNGGVKEVWGFINGTM